MSDLVIEMLSTTALTPWKRNARTHSKKQLRQIADSIKEFGFTNPVLIDRQNQILAGHGRVEAAKLLGMEEVPCVRLEHMTEAQKRAYVLADNKLALNAGWDYELLAEELKELSATGLDIDVGLTGFSIAEVDSIIADAAPEEPGNPDDDRLPEVDPASVRCKPGDIWQVGPHRIICGDARDRNTIAALMDGKLATAVITDPPYNVKIDGHVGGSGKIKHREFAMASGEMSTSDFTEFLKAAFQNLADFSIDGSIHFIFMDWRHMNEILIAGQVVYDELKNLLVWVKDNGGMGTFYRSRHELVFAFKKGKAPHINSFELGQHGRYRTNVWEYKGVNTLRAGRLEELALHPTVKPVPMLADAIKDVTGRGGIVLDTFGGSGSTAIAAEKTGRIAYLCEYDPLYCEIIIRRLEAFMKEDAVLVACAYEPSHQYQEAAE
jgi:DNA modification methylase